jgi:hypothetical protein
MSRKMPFVTSVIRTSVYDRLISVAVCPGGQLSVVAGGETVKLPVTDPFFTLNVPPDVTGDWVVVFFASFGI